VLGQSATLQQGHSAFWAIFPAALTANVGYWATLSLNIPDFTRYAKSQRSQMLGQALGLPTTMTAFAFIGVAVTSATIIVFGQAIWDPVVLVSKIGGAGVIIFSALVYMPFFVVGIFTGTLAGFTGARGSSAASGFVVMIGSVVALAGLATWIVFTVKYVNENGQSIAKRMLGIKVVRTDGSPITLGRLFWMRNVLNNIIGIIPFYVLVDLLFIFGEARQCLHDKLADTIVVQA